MSLVGVKRKEITIAEIGVYKGDNAIMMLNSTDNIKKLYLVDPFPPNHQWFTDENGNSFTEEKTEEFFNIVKQRFQSYGDKVSLIRKDSAETAKDFPDKSFDYVYIDDGHDYESVKRDLNSWYPKVNDWGVLGGHDSVYGDVQKAIIEFTYCNKLTLHWVNAIRNGITVAAREDFEDWWILKLPENE